MLQIISINYLKVVARIRPQVEYFHSKFFFGNFIWKPFENYIFVKLQGTTFACTDRLMDISYEVVLCLNFLYILSMPFVSEILEGFESNFFAISMNFP